MKTGLQSLVQWFTGAVVIALASLPGKAFAAAQTPYAVGVASADVTPSYPIRLTGYRARTTESVGVAQRLWAKALAITVDPRQPFVLLTVDNLGVSATVRNEVLRRLREREVTSERFALAFTHTHSAPALSGVAENIFGEDLPVEQQATIARYTRELTDALTFVAREALNNLHPARLDWGVGQASFAVNRAPGGGPVDHDLPVLAVRSPTGALRAIVANYACHCTTIPSRINQIHGDWAGYAQEFIQAEHRGATALVTIGCGAECNPKPFGLDRAEQHGRTVAAEVRRVLETGLKALSSAPTGRAKEIQLPLDRLPTREEWLIRANDRDARVAYHARKNLARLARGEALPTQIPYLVQTWAFGDELCLVFLPGEVVGDYSLRLKREFASNRLWVNAYVNDAPAYIPSRRVWNLGGYEGAGAMLYYDWPTRFAPEIEELIISTVHELIPRAYRSAARTAEKR